MYLPQPTSGGDFELPPAGGPYVAICTRFIDLGTQFSEHYNKSAHKVMIGWELADMADSQNRPYTIAKRYTFSMHQKAVLRKDLEAWRGAPFVESDFGPGGFTCAKLLGKACQMIVSHTDGERTYANVAAIMAMGKGMPTPEPISPLEYFALTPEEFSPQVFASLSDGIKRIIEQSPEYRQLNGGRVAPTPPRQQAPQQYAQRQQTQQRAQTWTQQEQRVAQGNGTPPLQAHHSADLNDEIPW